MGLFKGILLRVVAHVYKPSNQEMEVIVLMQVWNKPGLIIIIVIIEPYTQFYIVCILIWELVLSLP